MVLDDGGKDCPLVLVRWGMDSCAGGPLRPTAAGTVKAVSPVKLAELGPWLVLRIWAKLQPSHTGRWAEERPSNSRGAELEAAVRVGRGPPVTYLRDGSTPAAGRLAGCSDARLSLILSCAVGQSGEVHTFDSGAQ